MLRRRPQRRSIGGKQADVREAIQIPNTKLGEVAGRLDSGTVPDTSFIDAANSFTTDDVRNTVEKWKTAYQDDLIP